LHAPANHAHGDFAGGRGLAAAAHDTAGQNGGQNNGGAGGFQELAAVKAFGDERFFYAATKQYGWLLNVLNLTVNLNDGYGSALIWQCLFSGN
jgi:hypothetical protein